MTLDSAEGVFCLARECRKMRVVDAEGPGARNTFGSRPKFLGWCGRETRRGKWPNEKRGLTRPTKLKRLHETWLVD